MTDRSSTDITRPPLAGRPLEVVLVDPDAARGLERAASFAEDNVAVVTETNGYRALSTVEQRRPDLLVITDDMGDMTSLQLLGLLRLRNGIQDTPALAAVPSDDVEGMAMALALGAVGVIEKPCRTDQLHLLVRHAATHEALRREAAEAQQAAVAANRALIQINTDLDRFASAAAHDLKAPLLMIRHFAEILTDDDVEPDKRTQIAEAIAGQAARAHSLVGQLLEHALAIGDNTPGVAVDVGDHAEAVATLVVNAGICASNDIQIQHPLPTVLGAPLSVERVLQNLLTNAARYGVEPDGQLHITVSGSIIGSRASITVADRGSGIPESERTEIFGLGVRGSKGRDVGSGIGLATCQTLVNRMGGTLVVGDRGDGASGAAFTFTLPLAS